MLKRFFFIVVFAASFTPCLFAQADTVINPDEVVKALKLIKRGAFPFRALPGATAAEIKALAGTLEVYKQDSTFMTYTIYFSKDKYDFGDITYDFEGGKAVSCSAEFYFGKKETSQKALNLIKKNFDKIYRNGVFENGALEWKYLRPGKELCVSLSEIEFEGQPGFVLDFFPGTDCE